MPQGQWEVVQPCTENVLQDLVKAAAIELPPEYLEYLRRSNGGGGDIGMEPGLVHLWAAEEVAQSNQEYEVQRNVPGFYAFGSSGGGEMFAFDTHRKKPWPIVIIPFIPMDAAYAVQIATDFASFQTMFGVRLHEPPDETRLDGWGYPMDGTGDDM